MRRFFALNVFFFLIFFSLLPPVVATPGASCTNADGAVGTCRTTCSTGEISISFLTCSTNEVCCQSPTPGGAGTVPAPTPGSCPANFVKQGGVCFPSAGSTGLGDISVFDLLARVMNWLLGIIGVLAVVAFVISGTQYLVSAGDEDTAETAKRNMKYAIIGLTIALAGLIIINAITGLTGAAGGTAY